MIEKRVLSFIVISAMLGLVIVSLVQAQGAPERIYNTAKQKLMEGGQVFGGIVTTSDANIYCAMANAGFDFVWIEMQHSPLTYNDVARMIWACRGASAVPFVRVPDVTEGDIQKATDIGALGIIVPMVDTVEEAEAAVKYSKYPPLGRRSRGGGQYARIWGDDYRQTANDNIMVVAMIENPAGVEIVDKIAAVPGIDVVVAASGDLESFSGYASSDPRYEVIISRIQEETLKAGKILGGPPDWKDRRGFSFFWSGYDFELISSGAQRVLGLSPVPHDTLR